MENTGERYIPSSKWEKIDMEHNQRYTFALQYIKDKIVLDAACGEGYGSYLMAQTAKHVTGIDISEEAIEHASSKYRKDNLIFIRESVDKINLNSDSIDIVISFETIEHVNEEMQISFIKEIHRILKIDGILIMSTPNRVEYSDRTKIKNQFHVREFNKNQFEELISDEFSDVEFYSQYYENSLFLHKKDIPKSMMTMDRTQSNSYRELYMIAVASSTTLPEINSGLVTMPSLLSQDSLKDSFICGIFFDDGNGFSENNKQQVIINNGDEYFNYTIDIPTNIKSIRIDPVENYYCIVINLQIIADHDVLPITAINGLYVDNNIIFETIDPQIIINVPDKGYSRLNISGKIIIVKKSALTFYTRKYIALIEQMSIIESDLASKTLLLNAKKIELQNMEKQKLNDLSNIINKKEIEISNVIKHKDEEIHKLEFQKNEELEFYRMQVDDGLRNLKKQEEVMIEQKNLHIKELNEAQLEIESLKNELNIVNQQNDIKTMQYNNQIEEKMKLIDLSIEKLKINQNLVDSLYSSRSWRITKPFRSLSKLLLGENSLIKKYCIAIFKAFKAVNKVDISSLLFEIVQRVRINNDKDKYKQWIRQEKNNIGKPLKFSYNPLISVIIPTYNVNKKVLKECINSVNRQTYKNWQLCIVDDKSTYPTVIKTLKKYENDNRFKIYFRNENGNVARATNDAINMANGEFIAFLDCDDILSSNALYEMVKKLNENCSLDFIYSDEDRLTENGRKRHSPFFKPDWSPDTFMSMMYTCHFAIYRRSIANEIGGIPLGVDGAQDYAFTMRFIEISSRIAHVPKILYHWRVREESISENEFKRADIRKACVKLKEDALKRRGQVGIIEFINDMEHCRVKYSNELNPFVSIIILSNINYCTLEMCVQSIIQHTCYKNYEIIIIDISCDNDNRIATEKLCVENNFICIFDNSEANVSTLRNKAAMISKGELLLFMHTDVEVLDNTWLERLIGHASIKHAGAIGAKMLYPGSKYIQHVGKINLLSGPKNALYHFNDNNIYYFGKNRADYNQLAISGACLMVSKTKFVEIGGYDINIPDYYSSVALCFRLHNKGYYNCVRNDVILYHKDSTFRKEINKILERKKSEKNDLQKLHELYPMYKGVDPYYNPNLSQVRLDYSINTNNNNKLNIPSKTMKKNEFVKTMKTNIDSINQSDIVEIIGWALPKSNILSNKLKRYVILISNGEIYCFIPTHVMYRPDITSILSDKSINYDFAGFICRFDTNSIKNNIYNIAIGIKNRGVIEWSLTSENIVI